MAEDGINGLFENLSFKLFEIQKNEGIKKVCIPLINGVGYKDASHSEQIRAGLDILNAFQKKEGKFVPIFVDNAEAATYLRKMNCQVIRLIVYLAPKPELPMMPDTVEEERELQEKYEVDLAKWEIERKQLRIVERS